MNKTISVEKENREWVEKLRYTKSFLAKICLSGRNVKETYAALFNALMAYDGVTAKTSFSCATFSVKRSPIAKVTLTGKTLSLFLAIEPDTHAEGRYRLIDVGNVRRYALLPSKFRIRSAGSLSFALRLIEENAAYLELQKRESPLPPVTARNYPNSSLSTLLSRGLIRQIGEKKKVITVEKENLIYVEKEAPKDDEIFSDTAATNVALTDRHSRYAEILSSFTGDGEIRFVKQSVIRAIDETWVTAIEDCLIAIDEIMRTPSRFIEETEELLPIERTKKVTTRSIRHLCQHTGLISRIENGVVIPSKLLNVFRDESFMTYENKFVNTLLLRLFSFVTTRYDEALEYGANRNRCVFSFTDKIDRDDEKGKISFEIELSLPTEEREKTRFFQSDLWARVQKLNEIITDYQSSEFAAQMGNAVIKPPVVRTNPILKNKNLRQCLDLWEFLESYDDEGVTTRERDLVIEDEQIDLVRRSLAEQYVFFRHFSDTAIRDENTPVRTMTQKNYELPSFRDREIVYVQAPEVEENPDDNEVAFYVSVALAAEELAETEAKEIEEEIQKEREELLEESEEKEEIKSAVDTLPVSLSNDQFTSDEEPVSEKPEEPAPEATEEKAESEESEEEEMLTEGGEKILFVKSITAKLSSAGEFIQDAYCKLANAFLSKAGVKERKAFDHVDFYKGRKTLARIFLVGKTIRIYFPLSPESLDKKYSVSDRSNVKKFEATPTLFKVRGPRSLKHALELAALVANGFGENHSFTAVSKENFPKMTTEEALAAGEIRRRVFKGQKSGTLPRREEAPRIEYDYSEEAAAYNKAHETEERTIVLDNFSGAEVHKTLEKTERELLEEEIQEEMKEAPILVEGPGDPLLARMEAEQETPILLEREKEPEPEPEAPKPAPAPVPLGGDELRPKPVTLADLDTPANAKQMQKPAPKTPEPTLPETEKEPEREEKKGLFSRLFGRKNKQ